ncbi:MAG: hypothetical protein J6W26_06635 [Bacteroidales bacterium]|nr:hypothetical protein [Bacteroidales bacterium]
MSLIVSMMACMLSQVHGQNRGQVTATAEPNMICPGESSHLHAEAVVETIIDFETGDFSQLSQYSFTNSTTYPWTVVAADNGSSYCMKSGNGGVNNSTSTISAEVTFTTIGVVRFDAKCMGEGSYTADDKCIFFIDGQQQFAYGTQVSGWQNYSYIVTAGNHTFTWSYSKDGSISPTGDAFFVDNIAFNDNAEYSEFFVNFETGSFSQANFNNTSAGSNYPWIVTNNTSASGSYCMMSGNNGIASSSSAISLTHVFESPGYISFDAKCMGEGSSWDVCTFYIDGEKKFEKGANGNTWDSYFYSIISGTHTFKWQYTKDGSVNPTGDAFYVDNIALVAVDPNSGGSGSGDVTFTWTPGGMQGADITVTLTETTTYTVTAYQNNTPIGSAEQTVVVYQDPLLSISTNTGSAEICEGDTIVLYVTVGGGTDVKVGDIVCTDGSLVKPSDWPCEKTAKGIVFYVDATGQHGWAVDLGEITETKQWSTASTASQNISGLQNHDSFMDAITDLDGYNNTQAVRSAGNASNYPAAYAVDFSNGWYLPSAGQLNILYGEYFAVNTSLELVGGLLINSQNNAFLWSSSAASSNQVWIVTVDKGYFQKEPKTSKKNIRAVIDF